jgi:hypothetical protein
MALCQKCGTLLEGDFGVVQCLQCGEMNFLDEGPASGVVPPEPPSPGEPAELSSPEVAPAPPEWAEPPSAEEAIQEIADFGNSSVSSSDGVLVYDVRVSGIDSLELRNALVEALKDPKFRWNAEELEASIKNGVLHVSRVSPVKASVLIKKIRHLDLEVSWTQGNIYENPPAS